MAKSILFVCLGNICRSPAAEGIFLKKIKDLGIQDQFKVDSAGTGGWHVGSQADARMREAAKQRGVKINSLARQINLGDLYDFDFILTMDNANLRDVNSLASDGKDQTRALVQPLLTYSKNNRISEVPDPYYGGQNGFEEVLDIIDDAIEGFLEKFNSED